MVYAVINDKFKHIDFHEHSVFNLYIPKNCPGVPENILNPRNMWKDKDEYDKKAKELAEDFKENFKKFKNVSFFVCLKILTKNQIKYIISSCNLVIMLIISMITKYKNILDAKEKIWNEIYLKMWIPLRLLQK